MTDRELEELRSVLEEIRRDNRRQQAMLERLQPVGFRELLTLSRRFVTYPCALTARVWRNASDAGRVMMLAAGLSVLVLLLGVLTGCREDGAVEVTVSQERASREDVRSGSGYPVGDVPVVTLCGESVRIAALSERTVTVEVPTRLSACPVTVSPRVGAERW